MRVSHWTLNLPNSRLSFGAIVSAELLLSKKKQMILYSWSTIRSRDMMFKRTMQSPEMKLKYTSHFFPSSLIMLSQMSFSFFLEWSTQMRQVKKEMIAEITTTMALLMTPFLLKRTGKLSSAPPNILLNMARIVDRDEFFGYPDIILYGQIFPHKWLNAIFFDNNLHLSYSSLSPLAQPSDISESYILYVYLWSSLCHY